MFQRGKWQKKLKKDYMENNCLFCKIAAKTIPAAVIYEDELVLAFLDINPMASGHTLVIPKIHTENILDLPDDQIEPFFQAVKKVVALLQERLKSRGFTIGINHGKISGQAIDHLHVHIVPRYEGDGGGSLHSVVKNPPQESLKEIQAKIVGK